MPPPSDTKDTAAPLSPGFMTLAQVIIIALHGILSIDPHLVDELRLIAAPAVQPVVPGPVVEPAAHLERPTRRPKGQKTINPCGTCSRVKLKCKKIILPEKPDRDICERCLAIGLPECPPHEKWSARRNKKNAPGPSHNARNASFSSVV